MEADVFYNAMKAGAYIAFPKGFAGIYIIQQVILHGPKKGLFASIGCIATTIAISLFLLFGVHININEYIIEYQVWVKIALGIFACGLGMYFICKDVDVDSSKQKKSLKSLLIGFGITVINPLNLITTSGFMVNAYGKIYQETIQNKFLFVLHIVEGSFLLYICMIGFVWFVMQFIKTLNTRHVNVFFGTIYVICGIGLFITIFIPISI